VIFLFTGFNRHIFYGSGHYWYDFKIIISRIANNPPLRFLSINTLYIFIQKNWGFLAILFQGISQK